MPKKKAEVKWNGELVDRSDLAQFTHVIRDPNDPERSPRSARKGQETKVVEDRRKWTVDEWYEAIDNHLRDYKPRTFNRIMVELADMTADLAMGEAPDDAIWLLVQDGRAIHTMEAPILFKRRVQPLLKEGRTYRTKRGRHRIYVREVQDYNVIGHPEHYFYEVTDLTTEHCFGQNEHALVPKLKLMQLRRRRR